MVEFHLKLHREQGVVRIPKVLRENLGNDWRLIPNTKAAIIFPETADIQSVLNSLSIIQQDLANRLNEENDQREKKGKSRPPGPPRPAEPPNFTRRLQSRVDLLLM